MRAEQGSLGLYCSCMGGTTFPKLTVFTQKLQISEKKLPGDPMKRISFLGDLFLQLIYSV